MPKDDLDILDLLKFELQFLEAGGYGRSPHAPQRAPLIFEDSLTCMNFNSSEERVPCSACLLMQFVPPNRVSEQIPCRHILLNTAGQTLASLYDTGNQQQTEEALGNWLRTTIQRLENERRPKATNA